jgi:hypothetical protein
MISSTMGLNFVYFLDQPFKTRNQFQNDQISLSDSSPRRHTNLRLRAAALLSSKLRVCLGKQLQCKTVFMEFRHC